MRLVAGWAALALLVACDSAAGSGLSAEENEALNEAAAMLDAAAAGEGNMAAPESAAETGDVLVADEAATNSQ